MVRIEQAINYNYDLIAIVYSKKETQLSTEQAIWLEYS